MACTPRLALPSASIPLMASHMVCLEQVYSGLEVAPPPYIMPWYRDRTLEERDA